MSDGGLDVSEHSGRLLLMRVLLSLDLVQDEGFLTAGRMMIMD